MGGTWLGKEKGQNWCKLYSCIKFSKTKLYSLTHIYIYLLVCLLLRRWLSLQSACHTSLRVWDPEPHRGKVWQHMTLSSRPEQWSQVVREVPWPSAKSMNSRFNERSCLTTTYTTQRGVGEEGEKETLYSVLVEDHFKPRSSLPNSSEK